MLKINIDGITLPEQRLGFFHVERDNSAGYVWDWVDLAVPGDAVSIFDAMGKGKTVLVRFEGKYRQDLTLSNSAKESLRDTLDLYRLMKTGMHP